MGQSLPKNMGRMETSMACINGLNPTVQLHVEGLRRLCNEDYVHMPRGHLSENDFQSVILKATNAFLVLGLPIQKIHDIQIQISFPTFERRKRK